MEQKITQIVKICPILVHCTYVNNLPEIVYAYYESIYRAVEFFEI